MTFCYATVSSRPKLFHRLTGLTLQEFDILLDKFGSLYVMSQQQKRLKSTTPSRRAAGGGRRGQIKPIEGKLFFILVYARIYPLLIFQGLFQLVGELSL